MGRVAPRPRAAACSAWIGFAIGLVIGVVFVDDVDQPRSRRPRPRPGSRSPARSSSSSRSSSRPSASRSGRWSRRCSRRAARSATADQVGWRARRGARPCLVVLWLLIPALASHPGLVGPRRCAGSWIARQVQSRRARPAPVGRGARSPARRGAVPRGVPPRSPIPGAGDPPLDGLDPTVAAAVAAGVVRVEGQACDLVSRRLGVRGLATPSSSPTRTWSRGSGPPACSPRTAAAATRSSSRSIPTATSRCSASAVGSTRSPLGDVGRRRRRRGRRPSRWGTAARARRRASTASSTRRAPTSTARPPTEPRRVRARGAARARRLGRAVRRRRRHASSASRSRSTPATTPPPTRSRAASSTRCSAGGLGATAPVDTGPCLRG